MRAPRHLPRAEYAAADANLPSDEVDVVEVACAMLMRNFELLRRRSSSPGDLDRSEYLLLRTLDAIGPADICTLAASLGLDPSTAGRQVAVMARHDLVERTPAVADRRRTIISPTGKGRERMNAARVQRREAVAALLADWTEDEVRTLADMFTRYNRAVAEHYLTIDQREPTTDPLAATEALLSRGPVGHRG
jgi:DNA-binding MarR family transcriptional regulator